MTEENVGLVKTSDLVPAVVETASTAVAAREKAGVEARFLMALQQPRNPDQARLNILAACRRPRFAASVQYAKPIGGGKVTGLSIRFAEEAHRAWGNLYVRQDVVFDDRERRVYRVTGTDLETNSTIEQDVIVEKFVERKNPKAGDDVIGSRTNSRGEKVYLKAATEDEIMVKAHALLSKARRNIILSLIPSDIREEAEEVAMDTVKNRDAKDPEGSKKAVLDNFYQIGVSADEVAQILGKALTVLNPADLSLLRNLYTAIRDGDTTVQEVLGNEGMEMHRAGNKADAKKKGTAGLKAAVKKSDADILAEDAELT